ncbi:hypothetical protein ACFSQT_16690 [Mesorhizobium calcicola]|uniref:Uncharacterized protein n=1 Tax=Mesorhizobium calcicola TaxID=1300310 RepID=A0ABW4WGQ2_9HYPH
MHADGASHEIPAVILCRRGALPNSLPYQPMLTNDDEHDAEDRTTVKAEDMGARPTTALNGQAG